MNRLEYERLDRQHKIVVRKMEINDEIKRLEEELREMEKHEVIQTALKGFGV